MKIPNDGIIDYGDSAILIEFSKTFTEEAWEKAHNLAGLLRQSKIDGLLEIYPTYTTVLITFNCLITDHYTIKTIVNAIMEGSTDSKQPEAKKGQYYRFPVIFGGKCGSDLPFVAEHLGTSEAEVIKTFCSGFHKIFTFATFGGLLMEGAPFAEKIPRLKTPHTQVPGGYVAVAGNQTAFVPVTSPSGWRTIGHCPLKVLDLEAMPPVQYNPGDYIEFFPITEEEESLYSEKTIQDMKVML